MITILIIFIIGMLGHIFNILISIKAMAIKIGKDAEVRYKPNDLEKNYQFIKGLY